MTARALVAVLVLTGCCNEVPLEDAAPPEDCGLREGRPVDILWIVQTWSSSYDLRYRAGFLIEPLVRALEAGGAGEIRMAVTTGSVGPAGAVANGCTGDPSNVLDGVLLERGDGAGRVFGTTDADISLLGGRMFGLANDGCGNSLFEAAVRAIGPADFALPIGVTGAFHGDVENAGFVRPGDVLVIVLVTAVDDCSWNGSVVPGLVVPEVCAGSGECCQEVVHPIGRYLDAFDRLEERLGVDIVLASFTGVREADVSAAEWRTRAPRACVELTPLGWMPWRILEVTDALRPDATSQSFCALREPSDYETRARAIAARALVAPCE